MAELSLYAGTPVEIERIGGTRYTDEKLFGRIEMVEQAHLRIIMPAVLLQILPLDLNEEIQLKASLPEGMYRFSGKILERSERGFTMPYPFTITRLQRREQRRIPADGIAIFAPQATANARPSFGTLVDLSIGGLQLHAEKWLPVGISVEVEFSLQAGLRGGAIGLICWKKDAPVNSAETRTYCYGIKFTKIDEQIKQQIAAYIREYERNQLGTLTDASQTHRASG